MMELYRISVPWALKQLGVRKWLTERALHVPERYLEGWCELLSKMLDLEVTPKRWRQIEQRMADLVYDGVMVKVD